MNHHLLFILTVSMFSISFAKNYILQTVVLDEGGKRITSTNYISGLSFGQHVASSTISSGSYRAILGFWGLPYGGGIPGIEEKEPQKAPAFPIVFSLSQNYPNPFSHQTVIRYFLPVETDVNLKIFNSAGRVVKTLVNEKQKPDYYNVTWNLKGVSQSQLPNGVYFYRLEAGDFAAIRKTVKLQ